MVEIPSDDLPFLYADFMRQIKNRFVAIELSLGRASNASNEGAAYIELEFCMLQLRYIVELMALSSLIAHNEIKDFRTKKFVRTWNADALLNEMAKHSPSAFPTPVRTTDPGEDGIADLKFHPLTAAQQDQIVDLYRQCGDTLHIGALRSIIRQGGKTLFANKIIEHTNFLLHALEQHVVILPCETRMMVAFLRYAPTNDVHCFLTDVAEGGVFDPRSFPTQREADPKDVSPKDGE